MRTACCNLQQGTVPELWSEVLRQVKPGRKTKAKLNKQGNKLAAARTLPAKRETERMKGSY